jgi:hypothetical protein
MDVRFFMFGQKAHFPASAMRQPDGIQLHHKVSQPAPVIAPPSPIAFNVAAIYQRRRQEFTHQ